MVIAWPWLASVWWVAPVSWLVFFGVLPPGPPLHLLLLLCPRRPLCPRRRGLDGASFEIERPSSGAGNGLAGSAAAEVFRGIPRPIRPEIPCCPSPAFGPPEVALRPRLENCLTKHRAQPQVLLSIQGFSTNGPVDCQFGKLAIDVALALAAGHGARRSRRFLRRWLYRSRQKMA